MVGAQRQVRSVPLSYLAVTEALELGELSTLCLGGEPIERTSSATSYCHLVSIYEVYIGVTGREGTALVRVGCLNTNTPDGDDSPKNTNSMTVLLHLFFFYRVKLT